MKPMPLMPALPEERAGPRWGLAASAVVHALVILALFGFAVRQLPPDGGAAPSYDLIFDGPAGGAPLTEPNAATTQPLPPAQPADIAPPLDAVQGIPALEPRTMPDPAATSGPLPAAESAPPPAPVAAPAPQVSTSAPPPPAPLAPPDQPASIPLEAPPPVEAPAVRLDLPGETTAAAPRLIMPEPPPPLPPLEPRPKPIARPAPRAAPGTLSNPMDFSLAPSAPRPAARGTVASRALDLSAPAARQGPAQSDAYADIRAANASAAWNDGLQEYWVRHRYYPEQAAANGEQGYVTLQLTVNRLGRVESVEVVTRSGSPWLDMAALGTWRNAKLPPFTNEMREDHITFTIPIHYILVGR